MAYNFHFNVSRQLLDQVPAASFFFFLNLQKKLLDQNFSYAALLDEKEAKGNSLVPKLDTLLSLFSFPSSNIDEKSATFSLEGKNSLLILFHFWFRFWELFPSEIRQITSGLIECIAYIPIFVTLKLFVEMKYAMGLHGVFFFYASVGFITTLYGAFTIPDFRTKSLVEIEMIYNSKTPLIAKQ